LHGRVRHVILRAIVRSNGGEMRYIPDWETLAETLARVVTTNGLSTSEAQRDICRALGDAKIRVQPTIDPSTTEIGSQLVDVPLSPWRGERQRLERQKIVPVPLVPKNLDPHDFDWENSRPKSAWLDNRGFPVGIAKLELSTWDVIRILCGGRTGRPASDALHGGSSVGLKVQATEPASPPKTDVASADQVAGLDVQAPEPLSPQEPIARSSEPATVAERKATSAEMKRAIDALAAKLKIDDQMRPKEAKQLICDLKLPLGPFQFRKAWREARRQRELPLRARAGRPKKSSG
jgi:hypothetical protein